MSMPSSPCSRFLKGCWKRSVFRQSALPSCLPHWKRRTSASRVRDASLHVSGRGPWNLRETAYGKVGGGALPTRRRWTVSFLEIVVVRTGVPPNPLPKLCRWLGRRLPDLNPQDIKKNTNTVQHARQQRALHKNRTHQPPILRRMERQNVLGMYRAVRDWPTSAGFFLQSSRSCAHPLLVVVLFRYSDGISLAALTIHMSWQWLSGETKSCSGRDEKGGREGTGGSSANHRRTCWFAR